MTLPERAACYRAGMRRALLLASLLTTSLLLAACTGGLISVQVPAWDARIFETGGEVCYQQIDAPSSPVPYGRATYRADATYDSNAVVGSRVVTLRFYGRATAPAGECVAPGEADRPLSDDVTLDDGEPKAVAIGGGEYGDDLAALAKNGTFWLGATARGNWAVGTGEIVEFSEGTIRLGF